MVAPNGNLIQVVAVALEQLHVRCPLGVDESPVN